MLVQAEGTRTRRWLRWLFIALDFALVALGGRIVYNTHYFTILFAFCSLFVHNWPCTIIVHIAPPRVRAGVNVLACFLDFKCDETTYVVCVFISSNVEETKLKNAHIGNFGTSVCEKTWKETDAKTIFWGMIFYEKADLAETFQSTSSGLFLPIAMAAFCNGHWNLISHVGSDNKYSPLHMMIIKRWF